MSIGLEQITKYFGDHLVVNQVSLKIEEGELFVLLGGSGSGKSTILRVIAGLLSPDTGVVTLKDKDVTRMPPQGRGVGFVFQNYALFRHMTVAENIEFGLRIRGMKRRERHAKREEMLDLVGLGGLGERYPSQLSGGQRQRVAVARALAFQPSVLLLDEPFGALDVQVRMQLRESFRDLQKKLNITTVLVTHDQEEAFELADRVGVVDRGRLVEVGTPRALYSAPRSETVATFVGGGNVLVGRLRGGRIVLGEVSLPFPESAPKHDEGSPVRILFRPESVSYRVDPIQEGMVLGQATLKDSIFVGAQERMRFEVPVLHGVRQLSPQVAYGQRNPVIEASRPSILGELRGTAATYWLGLKSFHVLDPFGLKVLLVMGRSVQRTPAVDFSLMLASAAKGGATLLKTSTDENAGEHRKSMDVLQRELTTEGGVRLEAKVRVGGRLHELVAETQEGFYEVVIIDRAGRDGERGGVDSLTRELLERVAVPVLLVGESRSKLNKILICTAGGEPGRADVRMGGRIARQTGAVVTLFHVFRPGTLPEVKDRVMRHLEGARSMLYSLGIEGAIEVRDESPLPEIQRETERGDYDLIVIGASPPRLGGPARGPELAQEIVNRIQRPVLVVPPVR